MKRQPRLTATKRKARGTQVAELAIVLPLLLFLSLAVSEGAYMIRVHQVLNNAAREGARLAVEQQNYDPVNPLTDCTAPKGSTQAALCQAIISYAQNNGISAGSSFNQCNGAPGTNGLNITVNQNYLVPAVGGGLNINGTQVQVLCPYNLAFLPRLPSFGITGTVTLKGNVVFRDFF
ncbi:MAG TPA: TadE/TadG family type IV pilus assembly protein [Terriglobales bacterium]|nr:TadE/TadG family type IV pilus assembly protein [Terriglobales bacterium]